MYRDVLPTHMFVHCICAGPVEARGDVMFSFVSYHGLAGIQAWVL